MFMNLILNSTSRIEFISTCRFGVFTRVVAVIVKTMHWKQLKCLSAEDWLKSGPLPERILCSY